jgi:hypothetical protein
MLRVSAWSIAIPLILLSIGFIFIGTIGYAMSPEWHNKFEMRREKRSPSRTTRLRLTGRRRLYNIPDSPVFRCRV